MLEGLKEKVVHILHTKDGSRMHLAWHSQGKLQEGSSRMGLHCQGRVVQNGTVVHSIAMVGWSLMELYSTAKVGGSRMGLHCQAFHHLYCLYVTGVSSLCLDKPLTTHLRGKISSLFSPGPYRQVHEGCSVQGVSGGEWASCDPGTV